MSSGMISSYEENKEDLQRKAYTILKDLDEGEGLKDNDFIREWEKRYDKPKQYGRWALWDFISEGAVDEKLDRVERIKSASGHVYTIYGKEGKYDKKKTVKSAEGKLKKWNSDLTRKLGVKDISRVPINLFEDWAKRQDKYFNSSWKIAKHQEFKDLHKNLWENVLMAKNELKDLKDIVVYLEVLNSNTFDRYEIRVEQRKFKDKPMRIIGESGDYTTSYENQKLYGLPIQNKIVDNKIEDSEEIIRCVENMIESMKSPELLENTLKDLDKWKMPRDLENIDEEFRSMKKEGKINTDEDLFNLLVEINSKNPFYPPYNDEHGDHIVRESGFHALLEKYREKKKPRAGTVESVKGLLEGVKSNKATKKGKSKFEKRKTYINHAKSLLKKYGEHKF